MVSFGANLLKEIGEYAIICILVWGIGAMAGVPHNYPCKTAYFGPNGPSLQPLGPGPVAVKYYNG